MKKIHLIRTELPLTSGVDQTADCGAKIKKAYFARFEDGLEMGKTIAWNPRMCRKCWNKEVGPWRYFYGAVDGQESM